MLFQNLNFQYFLKAECDYFFNDGSSVIWSWN